MRNIERRLHILLCNLTFSENIILISAIISQIVNIEDRIVFVDFTYMNIRVYVRFLRNKALKTHIRFLADKLPMPDYIF